MSSLYPRPGNKSTVYVGNPAALLSPIYPVGGFDQRVSGDQLRLSFLTFGPIVEVVVPRDMETGTGFFHLAMVSNRL